MVERKMYDNLTTLFRQTSDTLRGHNIDKILQ